MPKNSQEKNSGLPKFSEVWPRIVEALGTDKTGQIARKIGIKDGSVSEWKTEERLPGLASLLGIAEVSGFSLHYLLTGEGEKHVTPVIKTLANETEVEKMGAVFLSQFHNLPDEAKAAISERLITEIASYLQQPKEAKKKTDPIVEQNNFLMSDPSGANAGTKRLPRAIRLDIEDAKEFVEQEKKKQRKS